MQAVPDWLKANPFGTDIRPSDVIAELGNCPDWETRFHRLLALADQLPALPESELVEGNRLHGCNATVWVTHAFDVKSQLMYVGCDADARVVKGLLACILSGYNGQSLDVIRAFDAKAFLGDLQLDDQLISVRRNGLLALIGKVRMLAHRYADHD